MSESSLVSIAAAHGAANSVGAGVLAACDFALATENLRVCFPDVRYGLVPSLVLPVLHYKIPETYLRELFLMAEPTGAHRVHQMGLVHRVVPNDKLMNAAVALSSLVVKGAPLAVRDTKKVLSESRHLSHAKLRAYVMESHKHARQSDEAGEGIDALLKEREADWDKKPAVYSQD